MHPSYQEQEYKARINRVIDYIESNLGTSLVLKDLARVANFSPFHFHRIFGAYVGESLNAFVGRLRIEKAASMLLTSPKKTITAIAFETGFTSSASFARSFKEAFGISASQWRAAKCGYFSKICKEDSKNCKTNSNRSKDCCPPSWYIYSDTNGGPSQITSKIQNNIRRKNTMSFAKNVNVEIKNMPAMTVAYVRHFGPYKGNEQLFENLWIKLMKWAQPRGLMDKPDVKCMSVYHDDPDVTDEEKLRVSVCITVPADTPIDGEVGKMEIASGKYAIAHFEIDADEYQDAWNYIYGEWLPQSGYQPDDRLCYELCLNDPAQDPQHKHIVEICVPIKPL